MRKSRKSTRTVTSGQNDSEEEQEASIDVDSGDDWKPEKVCYIQYIVIMFIFN